MANPQKENGHTQLSNELFEVIIRTDFSLRELKTVLTIIRFTYGFNRKTAELSVRFLANATGIKFQHISSALNELESKNVITFKESDKHKQGRIILLNKNYENWQLNRNQKSDGFYLNSSQKSDGTVPKRVTETVTKKVTKKYINKDNLKTTQKNIFSIENLPINLNGELFYKSEFFYVTKTLLNEFKEKLIDMPDELFRREFYTMEEWIKKNGIKKDYKKFFINWLKKISYKEDKENLVSPQQKVNNTGIKLRLM